MSSPEFLFYQILPPTIANVIRKSISQGSRTNLEQVEKLLAGKPPAVMAEFNAWKRSTDCFMDLLPAGIRSIVNRRIRDSDWAELTHLIHSSRNEAAITEFDRWAARNNITLPNANGQQRVTNSPPPPYEQIPPPVPPRTSLLQQRNVKTSFSTTNIPSLSSPPQPTVHRPMSQGSIPQTMNQYRSTKTFRRVLTVPGQVVGLIIGTGGITVKGISQAHNVRIQQTSWKQTQAPIAIMVYGYNEENIIRACLDVLKCATCKTQFKTLICDNDITPHVLSWDEKRLFDFAQQYNTFPSTNNNMLELRSFDARSLTDAQQGLKDLFTPKPMTPTRAPQKKKQKKPKNDAKFNRPTQAVAVNTKITSACANLKENTNILVLGASGVGKSTFLNSIANYFAFGENYTQAKKSMTCTIVMDYTKYDDQKTPFNVVLTPSKNDDVSNENRVKGESCTIDPRCYSFKYAVKGKEKYIRIIDTPGLLDDKGVIQDGDNLKKILSYLKHFPDLHAICILMKPTEARLTVAFKYYINELLSRLHKDAAKNIIYFFTNTQGTNFTPGDTLGVLNEALTKMNQENGVEMKLDRDNIFCFDNDGFRYYAAQKFAKFPVTGEEATAQRNWVESAKETERFLQVVANLPSYEVGKSLAIHQARDTLASLAEPMAEKAKTIFLNKREIDQKIAEINRLSQEGADLDQRLHYQNQQYQKVPAAPRVVCAKCAQAVGRGLELLRVCHKNCPCIADHVPMGQTPDVKLCTIFADHGELCSECRCPWNAHERVNYDVVEFSGSAVDVVVQQGMDKKEAQRLAALDFIQRLEDENMRLDNTLQMLRQQSAAFAAFVRKHSLVVTNDAFSGYIDLCIQAEKTNSNQDLTQRMIEFKEKYQQELDLYRTSGTASESLTFENINEKLEELLNDPDLGIYLSSIKEFLEDTPDSSELDKGCKNLATLFGKMTV